MFADIEINENPEDKKAGRTQIKMTALTIHDRGQWNRRGMTWLEEYVTANIESIIGAPFVVCFIDDEKTIPSGHGTLSYDDDGNCQFLDSDTVGTIQKAWIEEIDIDGNKSKKLVVSGYLYSQRHPKFIRWLKSENSFTKIKGSVEANGKGDSKQIIYEGGGDGKDADGNWIMGRIPVVFDFAGLAILLPEVVTEADPGSEILELNTLSTDSNSDDIEARNKEDEKMADIAKDPIIELNEKIVELNNTINELNAKVEEKDSELNKYKEELNACRQKETELNTLLVEANKCVESHKAQVAELNTEIEPLRKMKADTDTAKAQAEVNSYFNTIKEENGFTDTELNSLKEAYVEKCDLAGLKAKEAELCVNKLKDLKKSELVSPELNSQTDDLSSLFFSTKVETVETNSADDGSELFK